MVVNMFLYCTLGHVSLTNKSAMNYNYILYL